MPEMLAEIDNIANKIRKPTAFYLGKLQDALALDPLTGYSTVMIPFFAAHPYAHLTLLTKSTNIERLLNMDHQGHSILSWSVNPPEVSQLFEENVPDINERLKAMSKAALAGYPIRAVMMPIVPVDKWPETYSSFLQHILEKIPLQRLTLGGICSYKAARALMESKLGANNTISTNIESIASLDGRNRYSTTLRAEMYRYLVDVAKKIQPSLKIALCLEEEDLWRSCGIEHNRGICNCVL